MPRIKNTIEEFWKVKGFTTNDDQKEAILHKDGPLLNIAGQGSGKPKTLVEIIVYLIHSETPAEKIMTATFTEKAAKELITRVSNRLLEPENKLFWTLLQDQRIEKIWFTGMLTHGQTDFVINNIDPTSHTLRSYYPDFLVQLKDSTYVIVEVMDDNMIENEVVKAKADYANQIAIASQMSYK